MSKIVLVAYHSDKDSEAAALLQLRGILYALPSQEIFSRFEAFDVVDKIENK